jgi:hypothetical protein
MNGRGMKLSLLVGLVAALGLGRMTPAVAQANTSTSVVRFPYNFPQFNGCTGEDVQITGEVQTVSHTTTDATGAFQIAVEFHFEGTAVGKTSGNRYLFVFSNQTVFYSGGPNPTELTVQNRSRFLSLGPAPNEIVNSLFHFTVNANGVVTAFVDNFSFECTG